MPSYKSYCWSLGTTSFRTREFNKKIEEQLHLLKEFRKTNTDNWKNNNTIQVAYYNHLKSSAFVDGNAPNKAKDAREKTSGLVDIGLVNSNRFITEVGEKLLNITDFKKFKQKNILNITMDSYIYTKQLLKTTINVDTNIVRPFVITVYLLTKLEYLSYDEFTFLVPLVINKTKLDAIIKFIKEIRESNAEIDEVIIDFLMEMDNYKKAKHLFIENDVSVDIIKKIGLNRKSRDYDAPYYDLYVSLYNFSKNKTEQTAMVLLQSIKKINGNSAKYWRSLVFKTTLRKGKKSCILEHINYEHPILNATTEINFKELFFKLLHLYKTKATLSDYFDLNRRYLKTTDTIIFKDDKIELDMVPKCFFTIAQPGLEKIAFLDNTFLESDCDIKDISPYFDISEKQLADMFEKLYGVEIKNIATINEIVKAEKYARFNKLIEKRFDNDTLLSLLDMFEKRQDSDIQNIITANADVPTLFEYVIGIIWYKISEYHGEILDYLNLALDADLLPKSHAGGGVEDITYYYDECKQYPKHCLLIEVTLSEKNTQRRMEMEPVSRHLGDFMLSNSSLESYCLFVSTYLHLNVISDFRSRRKTPYYSTTGENYVPGMKIIPFQTSELKKIIKHNIKYKDLYNLFSKAYLSDTPPNSWYLINITEKISKMIN